MLPRDLPLVFLALGAAIGASVAKLMWTHAGVVLICSLVLYALTLPPSDGDGPREAW